MPYLLAHHKVDDYAKWKAGFDIHEADRRALGSKGGFVLQNPKDANDLWVVLEWEDEQSLREFAQSDRLRKTMKDAGVVGEVEMEVLEEATKPSI